MLEKKVKKEKAESEAEAEEPVVESEPLREKVVI